MYTHSRGRTEVYSVHWEPKCALTDIFFINIEVIINFHQPNDLLQLMLSLLQNVCWMTINQKFQLAVMLLSSNMAARCYVV